MSHKEFLKKRVETFISQTIFSCDRMPVQEWSKWKEAFQNLVDVKIIDGFEIESIYRINSDKTKAILQYTLPKKLGGKTKKRLLWDYTD